MAARDEAITGHLALKRRQVLERKLLAFIDSPVRVLVLKNLVLAARKYIYESPLTAQLCVRSLTPSRAASCPSGKDVEIQKPEEPVSSLEIMLFISLRVRNATDGTGFLFISTYCTRDKHRSSVSVSVY
jgi:hypothetical protein